MTTIVSSYYIISSKHSHEKYAAWIENFMTMSFNCIIFVDSVSHGILSTKFPETDTRKYRILELADFVVKSFGNWDKEVARDHEKSVGHTSLLYQIWHEKIHMIERVIKENPYNTKWFGWLDIGCFRSSKDLCRFVGFPRVGTASTVPPGKMTMLQIEPFVAADFQNLENVDERFRYINRIGGMFFGDDTACLQFANLHKNTLAEFFAKGAFAGKDQSVYAFMVLRQPSMFNLVSPKPSTYDRWFYFHEYLSDAIRNIN